MKYLSKKYKIFLLGIIIPVFSGFTFSLDSVFIYLNKQRIDELILNEKFKPKNYKLKILANDTLSICYWTDCGEQKNSGIEFHDQKDSIIPFAVPHYTSPDGYFRFPFSALKDLIKMRSTVSVYIEPFAYYHKMDGFKKKLIAILNFK